MSHLGTGRSNRRTLAAAAAVAVVGSASGSAQGQTCATASQCQIRDSRCVDGWCVLTSSRPVMPSRSLPLIELSEPAQRAVLVDGQPELRFGYPAGARVVVAFIMAREPVYSPDGTKLENPGDVKWYWSSGWEDLAVSDVVFSKGRVAGSTPNTCEAAPPLSEGTYYWGLLGYGADGYLSHQSELRTFAVDRELTTGQFCSTGADCGPAGFTTCTSTSHYCALRCASEMDCFEGSTCDLSTATIAGFPWGLCRPPGSTCPCAGDSRCDAAGASALSVCYRPAQAHQSSSECGGCGDGDGESNASDFCYQALAVSLFFLGRRRTGVGGPRIDPEGRPGGAA